MKNLKFIKKRIKRYGVSLLAISDLADCAICRSGQADPNHVHTGKDIFDNGAGAFVYTIGHRERRRPDLLFLCGPRPDEDPINADQQREYLKAAGSLINYLVKRWDEHPVLLHQKCQDHNGRVYEIVDHIFNGQHPLKEGFTIQTGVYYGSDDYELLLFIPVGWNKKLDS